MDSLLAFARDNWTSAIEILVLSVAIYYSYLYFRGTRGAKVLTGLLVIFLSLTLISSLLHLEVISWLLKQFSIFFAIALVVIFQPELRRALAELGSHHLFSPTASKLESIETLAETTFELSHKQFGALIAIERDTDIKVYAESGVRLDADFTQELAVTIFHPKTALHDGGVVLRNDRILAAACIFPVSQRENLDRNLGLRHRAALGLSEESDAISIVVSEETGVVSICHGGRIERDFDKETFRSRLNQLLLLEKYEETDPEQLEGENPLSDGGDSRVVSH